MSSSVTEHVEHRSPGSARAMPTPRRSTDSVYECEPFGLPFFGLESDAGAAPVRYQFRRELDVSPARLWQILEDPKSWPVWAAPGIVEVEWTTAKPYQVGTERTVFFIGGMEVYERFIAWTPEREMAFVSVEQRSECGGASENTTPSDPWAPIAASSRGPSLTSRASCSRRSTHWSAR